MTLSNENLLVILLVGIVAGWLAGKIVDGGGFGLVGDLIVGVIGAFIGDWLLPQLGIHLGVGVRCPHYKRLYRRGCPSSDPSFGWWGMEAQRTMGEAVVALSPWRIRRRNNQ